MQIAALAPRQRGGAPAAAAAGAAVRVLFWDDFWAATTPLCFDQPITLHSTLHGPNLYAPRVAAAWRADTRALLRMSAALAASTDPNQITLLLRTHDRTFTNADSLGRWVRARTRACGYGCRVQRLSGGMSFREQVELYARSSILISMHGAQLINAAFMAEGAVVVEVFNCGHFSDTYKAVILEAGVGYIATRDPRPGCDQDLGRHMSETSRRVGEAELLPALRAALAFRHADPACAGSAVDAGSAADNRTLEVATLRGGSHT